MSNQKLDVSDYGGRSSIWLEHKIVDLGVAGSIPVGRPICSSVAKQGPFLPREVFSWSTLEDPLCHDKQLNRNSKFLIHTARTCVSKMRFVEGNVRTHHRGLEPYSVKNPFFSHLRSLPAIQKSPNKAFQSPSSFI